MDEEMQAAMEIAKELSNDPTFKEEVLKWAERLEKVPHYHENLEDIFGIYYIVRLITVKNGDLRPVETFGPVRGRRRAIGKCAHINDVIWKKGRYDLFHIAVPNSKSIEKAYEI